MTSRDAFTNQEWDLLIKAPDLAANAVSAANPEGAVKEHHALLSAWAKSADQPFSDAQVVLALIRGRDTIGDEMHFEAQHEEWLTGMDPSQTLAAARDWCGRAIALLKQKATPEEVEAYKRWIVFMCEKVAGAEKSGGFLGVGGARVSDSEQAAISAVTDALNAA